MKKDPVRDFAIGSKWLERELNKTEENPLHSAKIFKKKAKKHLSGHSFLAYG